MRRKYVTTPQIEAAVAETRRRIEIRRRMNCTHRSPGAVTRKPMEGKP